MKQFSTSGLAELGWILAEALAIWPARLTFRKLPPAGLAARLGFQPAELRSWVQFPVFFTSGRGHAAVRHLYRAGHPARVVTREEEGGAGDVVAFVCLP